ncbi:MAG TPA: hypothetical protein VHK22_05350 [Gaiellaceae bacterium]|nr:hypothetical protein [Gaiellaceae bacterium]
MSGAAHPSYPVIWRRNGGPVYSGRLDVEEDRIRLSGTRPGQSRALRMEIPISVLTSASVSRDRAARLRGLPTLTLELRDSAAVQVAVVAGAGRLQELAAILGAHILAPEAA